MCTTSLLLVSLLAQTPQRVTLVFGGDVIPHAPIKQVASLRASAGGDGNNQGWDHVLGPLAPALQAADFAVVNLETPVIEGAKPLTGDMVFHAPPPLLHALKRVGVDVATFANNHCLDQQRDGISSTRAHLKSAGLLTAGADTSATSAWMPLILEKNGLKIGILAMTRWLNGFNNQVSETVPHVPAVPYEVEPIVGGRSKDEVLAAISAWSSQVDALLVSIHWGYEYQSTPTPEDREFASQMLEAGAAAIIGHHPHVLQPVEWVRLNNGDRRLVAFSLGNLVSNQDYADANGTKRDGLLLELEVVRASEDSQVQVRPTRGVAVATENKLGAGKRRNVQAVLLDDELGAIEERLADLSGRESAEVRQERARLEARRQVALTRRARIAQFIPPGLLEGRVSGAPAAQR